MTAPCFSCGAPVNQQLAYCDECFAAPRIYRCLGCREIKNTAYDSYCADCRPTQGADYSEGEPCVWPLCLPDPRICCGAER